MQELNTKKTEIAQVEKVLTVGQALKKVFPVQFKELDPMNSAAKISQEIFTLCSAYGITQCDDFELGLLVKYILDQTLLGPDDLTKAALFFFNRYELEDYGKPFNIRMLNRIIKPYTIHRKKEIKRQERDMELREKKFVPMPEEFTGNSKGKAVL